MLDAVRADAITGGGDPAASATVVHIATWALMGIGDEIFTDTDMTRLRETVRIGGVDTITRVWLRSPEFTLPNALWCVYLLYEWYHCDPSLVAERYAEGSRTPAIQGLEAPVKLRPLSLIMEEVGSLLYGGLIDDNLEYVLGKASHAMYILAAGKAGTLWVENSTGPLTHRVVVRHLALLVTADELDVTAHEVAVGTLGQPRVRCVVADLSIPWTAS